MRALVIQNVELEGAGLLERMFDELGLIMDIRKMWMSDSLPASLEDYAVLIILGGPMGADDEAEYPYLACLKELIQTAADRSVTTIGICLGGQLIARALGAEVKKNPVREIGWYPVTLTEEGRHSPVFAGFPDEFMVFQWHGDTFDIPHGAAHLVVSELCGNQAFTCGEHILAFQFHLEVNPEIIATWAAAYDDELEEFGGVHAVGELLDQTRQVWNGAEQSVFRFLENLGEIIKQNLKQNRRPAEP
ncbi:MAG: type 1 glutamine amidotransferase [Bacillota bacterium]